MPLRVGILGPVCAWRTAARDRDGPEVELALGQPRQQAVLGVLAIRANRVVSRADLIDAVWGDQPPASAEGGVYTYIAGLRRVLEPGRRRDSGRQPVLEAGWHREQPRPEGDQLLVSVSGGYMLRLEPGGLDAAVFADAMTRVRELRAVGDLARAEEVLAGALALWRGEALAGVPGPFAETERARLGELRTAAAEDRADLLLATGQAAIAVADLTALVAEHPLRERARALLMVALYRCGRQAEALHAYQDARARLARDLGIDPGPELAMVHQQVLTGDPALDDPAAAAQPAFLAAPVMSASVVAGGVVAGSATAGGVVAGGVAAGAGIAPGEAQQISPVPAQLPPEVAGFAGRAAELRRLHEMLDDGVVVIAGTAGVGKTALAVRFAREVAAQFPDGQLYVNLRGFDPSGAPVDPGTALRGLLEALRVPSAQVPGGQDAQTALLRSLVAGKRMLLLLDNARTASQVRPLLPGSLGCLVVVTSRDQLAGLVAAEGARLLPLDVLSADEARDLMAARLGADRISAEPAAVAELIRQSARLPLALSVASARLVTRPGITLAALSAELRDAWARLDAVDASDVATDPRAVFSWSLDWLSEPAARMFRLLGVVPGADVSPHVAASAAGVPLAAARSALAELCRASLLAEDGRGRFSCHDLLRAYAAEQAGQADGDAEIDAARLRVLDHYLRSAHDAAASVYPARTTIVLPPALPDVVPEHRDGYDDVVDWFRAEHKGLMAAIALAGTWQRGTASGAASADLYAWQLAWTCAPMCHRLGQWADAALALRTGLAAAQRLGDPVGLGQVHYELGYACTRLGEYAEADRNLRAALEIFTARGDWVSVGLAHHRLLLLFDEQGRFADALPHGLEALRLLTSFGDRAAIAYAENAVGWIYANLGQHAEALPHCRRALELHLESGARTGAADTLDSIGLACAGLGDHEQARANYQQAADIFREIGDPRGELVALIGLGDAHLALGHRDAARRSWERARTLVTAMPDGDASAVRTRLAAFAKSAARSAHGGDPLEPPKWPARGDDPREPPADAGVLFKPARRDLEHDQGG